MGKDDNAPTLSLREQIDPRPLLSGAVFSSILLAPFPVLLCHARHEIFPGAGVFQPDRRRAGRCPPDRRQAN